MKKGVLFNEVIMEKEYLYLLSYCLFNVDYSFAAGARKHGSEYKGKN
jgi:hypothetical protein